jgi:anaerobic carbon-monoxide dehydrogenase iron sulfur subunit
MRRVLDTRWELCKGCRLCELVCSLSHDGVSNPELGRIRVLRFPEDSAAFPSICMACSDPPCANACPNGAIEVDSQTGDCVVDAQRCVGCREWTLACPVGAIVISPLSNRAIKCDMCGGETLCAQVCPTGAVRVGDLARIELDRRRSHARSALEARAASCDHPDAKECEE